VIGHDNTAATLAKASAPSAAFPPAPLGAGVSSGGGVFWRARYKIRSNDPIERPAEMTLT